MRLTEHRAVVATEQKILEDTFAGILNKKFVGVRIFGAAFKPIVKKFFRNVLVQFFERATIFAGELIHFLLVEQRGVLEKFCAILFVIFGFDA